MASVHEEDYGILRSSLPPSVPGAVAAASVHSPRANALSGKITSILSTSYGDLDIRDALGTLDIRGIRNTPDTRRNLRLDVQKEVISCNGDIVKDFGRVAKQLQNVGTALANLQKTCGEIRMHVSAARLETAPILEEAETLMKQKDQVEIKQRMLHAFNAHFLLSNDEIAALTSTAEPVNEPFYNALAKAKTMYKDSQLLLGTENQRLGLEILDQTSKQLNAAFQKLLRWTQREFKSIDLENPHMNAAIRRALRVLAERPTLFQSCLDSFAEARERTLEEAFYVALTGSFAANQRLEDGQKPIEFLAHEPLRYLGDMLAWAHSSTLLEREALEVLFIAEGDELATNIKKGMTRELWSQGIPEAENDQAEVFDGRKALSQLVNRNLVGVAQILRQRIEQVVQGAHEPVLAYKIANLIGFYKSIFEKLLDTDAGFMKTLDALEESALDRFCTTMQLHVAEVQDDHEIVQADLVPPDFLEDALEELRALLKSYDTSATFTDRDGGRLQLLLDEALSPFLDGCEKLAEQLQAPANSIFAINCLLTARTTLYMFSFTVGRLSYIKSMIESRASKLVDHQHQYLLQNSGLQPLVAALSQLGAANQDISTISTLPVFQHERLLAASQQLDDFLPSALMYATESVKRLQSSSLASEVTTKAAVRFCEDFEVVEEKIVRADELKLSQANGEEEFGPAMRNVFPRTSEEIRILLS